MHAECFDQSVCYKYCWCPTALWHMHSSIPRGLDVTESSCFHQHCPLVLGLKQFMHTCVLSTTACLLFPLFPITDLREPTMLPGSHALCTLRHPLLHKIDPPALVWVYLPSPFLQPPSVSLILSQCLHHGTSSPQHTKLYTSTLYTMLAYLNPAAISRWVIPSVKCIATCMCGR